MDYRPLNEVTRRGVEALAPLLVANNNGSRSVSAEAGRALLEESRQFGLPLRDYLNLAIDVRSSEQADRFRDDAGFLSGYEASLAFLGLPVQDDFDRGVVLAAASDTFQTSPGTRALFPEVVDDVVTWKYRQETLENTSAIVGSSRTINGVELISTIVDDAAEDYQVISAVAELGRFPIKTIRMTDQSVRFFKHGGGYRVSYEFQRRARIDTLVPYITRMYREAEISKVRAATHILINGDGQNPAAPVTGQSSFDGKVRNASTTGRINYEALLRWLVKRARAGTPVDTVVGNWDAYIEWLMMFAVPTTANSRTDAENLAATGFRIGGVPILNGAVNFALSSSMPDNQLLGLSKGDTMEELIESGSQIDEADRAIQNQSITYVKSINAGYKLAFPDTREVYDYGA